MKTRRRLRSSYRGRAGRSFDDTLIMSSRRDIQLANLHKHGLKGFSITNFAATPASILRPRSDATLSKDATPDYAQQHLHINRQNAHHPITRRRRRLLNRQNTHRPSFTTRRRCIRDHRVRPLTRLRTGNVRFLRPTPRTSKFARFRVCLRRTGIDVDVHSAGTRAGHRDGGRGSAGRVGALDGGCEGPGDEAFGCRCRHALGADFGGDGCGCRVTGAGLLGDAGDGEAGWGWLVVALVTGKVVRWVTGRWPRGRRGRR